MVHICRDFVGLDNEGFESALYLTTIFMHGVMNFDVVGDTNFNLTGSILVASGSSGSINLGAGLETHVFLPGYAASAADYTNERILALRSSGSSRLNSGLFRIIGTGSFSGSTTLEIDFRSSGNPPIDSASLGWAIYPRETDIVFQTGDNGGVSSSYAGNGSATTSRIILQSPHSSSWQVRLCRETDLDTGSPAFSIGSQFTIAPGFGGNLAGDFPAGGEHLHSVMWHDISTTHYRGGTVGLGDTTSQARRFYIWGEDEETPGSVVICARNPASSNSNNHSWAAFGFCEDETQPLPPLTIQRMFSFGTKNADSSAVQNDAPWMTHASISTSSDSNRSLVGFSILRRPLIGGIATWSFLYRDAPTAGASAHPAYRTDAVDSSYVVATELLANDVMVGIATRGNISDDPKYRFEPRRLGKFPLARLGRSNFGDFTTSTDTDHLWIHMFDGLYMPWSGSNIP